MVNVEFIIIESGSVSSTPLTDQEIQYLADAARAIRLTAKIVDTPCNEMNVSHFIVGINAIADDLDLVATIIRGEQPNEQGFGE